MSPDETNKNDCIYKRCTFLSMVTRTLSTIRKAFKKGVILSLLFHLEIKRNVCYEGWREVQLRCGGVSDKPNVSSYMLLSLLFGWISQQKLFLGLFYKNERRKVFLSRYKSHTGRIYCQ